MEIIRLPWGEIAPEESDCVHVEQAEAGHWTINTSALSSCDDEAESDATIASAPYESYDAAEAAGLAIAAEQCVATVYISRVGSSGG